LEQINANLEFRDIARFFSETTYLHLVPQLLKFANLIGGNTIEQDPFGQGFSSTCCSDRRTDTKRQAK